MEELLSGCPQSFVAALTERYCLLCPNKGQTLTLSHFKSIVVESGLCDNDPIISRAYHRQGPRNDGMDFYQFCFALAHVGAAVFDLPFAEAFMPATTVVVAGMKQMEDCESSTVCSDPLFMIGDSAVARPAQPVALTSVPAVHAFVEHLCDEGYAVPRPWILFVFDIDVGDWVELTSASQIINRMDVWIRGEGGDKPEAPQQRARQDERSPGRARLEYSNALELADIAAPATPSRPHSPAVHRPTVWADDLRLSRSFAPRETASAKIAKRQSYEMHNTCPPWNSSPKSTLGPDFVPSMLATTDGSLQGTLINNATGTARAKNWSYHTTRSSHRDTTPRAALRGTPHHTQHSGGQELALHAQ